jgi:hypothetical protein
MAVRGSVEYPNTQTYIPRSRCLANHSQILLHSRDLSLSIPSDSPDIYGRAPTIDHPTVFGIVSRQSLEPCKDTRMSRQMNSERGGIRSTDLELLKETLILELDRYGTRKSTLCCDKVRITLFSGNGRAREDNWDFNLESSRILEMKKHQSSMQWQSWSLMSNQHNSLFCISVSWRTAQIFAITAS